MANYAQRRDALIRTAAEAGEMVGRQKMADLMALALNDPAVMGKAENLSAEKAELKPVARPSLALQKQWQNSGASILRRNGKYVNRKTHGDNSDCV